MMEVSWLKLEHRKIQQVRKCLYAAIESAACFHAYVCRRLVENDKTLDKDVKCTTTYAGWTCEMNEAKHTGV